MAKQKFPGINEGFLKKQAAKVTDSDIKKVTEKADEIKSRFEKGGPLGRFIEDGKLLLSIVKDYWRGAYREIPWWALSAIVFALIYVFSPVDIIPDVIPLAGLTDDAAVVAVCLILVEQQLQEYKDWKHRHSNA